MPDHVSSTGDDRTVNNTMRHQYRVLTDAEKARVAKLKDLGAEFELQLRIAGGSGTSDERMASRELSIAQTKIQEAVMWAVRHVTR